MVKAILWLVSVLTGGAFILVGLAGCVLSLIAIIDPVGTKMADDNDPFGVPPTLAESLGMLASFTVAVAVGTCVLWLVWRRVHGNHLTRRCS